LCLETPQNARPIRADVRVFDFGAFIASEHEKSGKRDGGFFDVILMDPPWQLAGQAPSRGVSLMYDQLHDKLIEDMPVQRLQQNGLIFIWVINNKFVRALDMMDKWGYKYFHSVIII
jgi:N6-adenosine-specific RNA methylase IME4